MRWPDRPIAAVEEVEMSATPGSCRVLVVEDDPLSRNALALLLEHVGCTVCAAESVSDALRLVDGKTHVITDLVLADSTSLALLAAIRRRPTRPRVAVMTALERDTGVFRDAAAFEPDLLLQKPVDAHVLLGWLGIDASPSLRPPAV